MWTTIELWCSAAGGTAYLTVINEQYEAAHKPLEWTCSCRECKAARRTKSTSDDQPCSSENSDRISVVIDIRGG
jgi:hypothetical protein